MWTFVGLKRPPFAEEPGPGQESVWDYPRPPSIVDDHRRVLVKMGDQVIADSRNTRRVLETASPPTFYLSPEDVETTLLLAAPGSSFCEWKGAARYWAVTKDLYPVGWNYPTPSSEFASIAGWYSFYPGRVTCTVDDEVVRPQPGGFYGGWITSEIVGPVKGEPGTAGW